MLYDGHLAMVLCCITFAKINKKKIEWLSESLDVISPHALEGKFHGTFKLVIGDWRVIYTADFANKSITIHLIGHRREIYKI